MNKKYITLISLIVLTVVGAMFTLLASNMLMDDLFNKGVSFSNMTIFVSLPAISIAVMFILGIFYFIRTYRHPECKKRIASTYLVIAMAFALLGVVGSILGGVVTYKTFVGPNPFPGYLILFMILNILVLCASCYARFFLVKKMAEDKGRIKVNFVYVLKTIGWTLFIGMVLSRLGLFLALPGYVYVRNLYQTFPTFLYLLLPVFLGVILVLMNLGILNKKKTFVMAVVALALNVGFFVYTIINGLNDTSYISSISQIYPIDRMASLPVEIIIHFLAYTGVGIAILLVNKKKEEKE